MMLLVFLSKWTQWLLCFRIFQVSSFQRCNFPYLWDHCTESVLTWLENIGDLWVGLPCAIMCNFTNVLFNSGWVNCYLIFFQNYFFFLFFLQADTWNCSGWWVVESFLIRVKLPWIILNLDSCGILLLR